MARDIPGDWFRARQINDHLYKIDEPHFFEGNRCNIWLLKGPSKDVIIDTGLGVCNLRTYLEKQQLIESPDSERQCVVICTHVHFDHTGGAHHFPNVMIHEDDRAGLLNGVQGETLNYVKPQHFYQSPAPNFSALTYKVPPTVCEPVMDDAHIDLGEGEYLQVIHLPGHTKGSIAIYWPSKRELFTGDTVYECGFGTNFLDWLPTSCVRDYVRSAHKLADLVMSEDKVVQVYPGHFDILGPTRTADLLLEYAENKDNACSCMCASCLQCTTWGFISAGCFRCCPC